MDEQPGRFERPAADRPHNRVAADVIIARQDRIVLIKRRYEPFKGQWCLPGGHVEHGEQVRDAAVREAKEETGLDVQLQDLFGVYDGPGRDPRGPVISIVYTATAGQEALDPATDAADAEWFPVSTLPDRLGFDHDRIVADYLRRRKE